MIIGYLDPQGELYNFILSADLQALLVGDPFTCTVGVYVGGCQDYGPFLDTLNVRGRIIVGIQKGTIILTTTHVGFRV